MTGPGSRQNGGQFRFRTAQAAVVELLRAEILSGRLAAGERLLQAEIAERYDTSTTPVREALRQLVSEGLLDGDAHRGVTVHETSIAELEELYAIRMVLEPMAIAATVENITPDELKALDDLTLQMEAQGDPAAWTALNAEFHATIAAGSRRPILAAMLTNLRQISALYIAESIKSMPERVIAGNEEHRALIQAIRDHDVEAAKRIERAHLKHTLDLGEAHLRARGRH